MTSYQIDIIENIKSLSSWFSHLSSSSFSSFPACLLSLSPHAPSFLEPLLLPSP